MTAFARRRRQSLMIGGACAVAGLLVAAGFGVVGAFTLVNSTDGAPVADDRPQVRFPSTPTALVAAVDDAGHLASLAVLVGRGARAAGGAIVTVPVSADAAAGMGDVRLPLAETFELDGPGTIKAETEIALGLTIDDALVLDAEAMEDMLAPLGEVDVDLPTDVVDRRGRTVAPEGLAARDAAELAAVLTARDDDVPAVQQYRATGAVWSAIAARTGSGDAAGAASAASGAPLATSAEPGTEAARVESLLAEVLSGPARHRSLRADPIDAELNPRRADVTSLDRSELALVFGQIAPGRVSAPATGLSYRIESPFPATELEERGWTRQDVAYESIVFLLFAKANVLSVDTTEGDVPDVTKIAVNDEALVEDLVGAAELFGEVEFEVAETELIGIDATVRLGESFLDFLAEGDVQPGPGTGDGDD